MRSLSRMIVDYEELIKTITCFSFICLYFIEIENISSIVKRKKKRKVLIMNVKINLVNVYLPRF